MAFPAIAAIPLVGKALAGLKGASAAKAGLGAYKTLRGVGVPKSALRFAGDKLSKVGRGFTPKGFAENLGIPMTRNDIAMSVAPDLLFGGFAAATTEGDLADKAIAGLGSSVGGIAGGLGARGLLGPKSGLGILGTEMVGGIIGDQVGYGAANSIIRAKHGGMTPTEKLMAEQDEQYRSQIVDEFLAQNGMG